MTSVTTVVFLRQPDEIDDLLTAVLKVARAACWPKPSRRKPRRSWRR